VNREAIWSAVFAKLQAVQGIATCSRRLKHWADVASEDQPAIYLAQGAESDMATTGQPNKRLLHGTIYVYVKTEDDTAPTTVLNPILDAIEAAFALHPVTLRHELEGIDGVEYCRVEGAIETYEGTLGNQEVALIPLSILAV